MIDPEEVQVEQLIKPLSTFLVPIFFVMMGIRVRIETFAKHPYFAGATFAGTGVVTDGLIITSSICPYMELKTKAKDGTEQVALALVAAMKDKKQRLQPSAAADFALIRSSERSFCSLSTTIVHRAAFCGGLDVLGSN